RGGIIERGLPQRPQPDAAPAVSGRVTRLQTCRNCRDFLLCLCATGSRFESYIRFNPSRTAVFEFVPAALEGFLHRGWNPELHRPAYESSIESLWRHADDGVRHIIKALHLANDFRVAFKTIAPHLIADDDDRMGIAADILARFE